MKIVVGLSGGVDSSVAALLLKREGHTVVGATMKLTDGRSSDVEDAQRVADQLGIPHITLNLKDEFDSRILSYLNSEYVAGRTPNPCIKCNREVKFGILVDRALEEVGGADRFATGHYARIERSSSTGRLGLRRGAHTEKDQTYFLSTLSQKQLEILHFPLGSLLKKEVRRIALDAGLSTHGKRDSQDLCLGPYRGLLPEGGRPGKFVDSEGRVMGDHRGIANYTIGQRRGLGIGGGPPLYVIRIDAEHNQIVLGGDEALFSAGAVIRDLTWGVIEEPRLPLSGSVKIRYRDPGVEATLLEGKPGGRYRIIFREPQRAVTPGQTAVFYQEEVVALAGLIDSAIPAG